MESFFRYIAYVDYYERGLRICNVGYLRWKMQNHRHRIEIEVKGVKAPDGEYALREEGGRLLGRVAISRGQGSWDKSFEAVEKGGRPCLATEQGELDLAGLRAFQLPLGDDRLLRIGIELPIETPKEVPGRTAALPASGGGAAAQAVPEAVCRASCEAGEPDPALEEEPAEKEVPPPLEEDKWQQLLRSYSQVHPFGGGRTFLTIKPEDFVILQQEYQKLVHNSFLLHGYYNYRHMILGKLEEGEDKPYYIGVPGVYYEKERQAAGLFGFAGFEPTQYPVANGSPGYYMIEVAL